MNKPRYDLVKFFIAVERENFHGVIAVHFHSSLQLLRFYHLFSDNERNYR